MKDFVSPHPIEGQPLSVGMLLYPGHTLLDLAAPHAALAMHGTTHLLWKTLDPVLTDSSVTVTPTTTFFDCPDNLDALFVPGGAATADMMEDAEVIAFLARARKAARYVTSVCSGSLILGMAGLLDGYKSATC